ncbi:hypothetical protein J2W91_004616 [Paenibacillus amylolyticus]|uniref:Uncharacterized protein n=1 Tax=Paenibacillus amylolyticus TaxID=1451 RepID=A0AAP5LQW2_PAEAM|nr:hypothetical protein [Paenibacillus amylolyticus]
MSFLNGQLTIRPRLMYYTPFENGMDVPIANLFGALLSRMVMNWIGLERINIGFSKHPFDPLWIRRC